ncbi:MAG: DUF4259 domain-containing protein [Magnetospiraceae bacterium]
MGAFGGGGFENDDALDFAATVTRLDDLTGIFAALPANDGQPLDADTASRLIAAAECVAALRGHPAADLPEELDQRLKTFGKAPAALVAAARDAVSRVLMGSELLDLWAEADPAPFNRAMDSLIERLNHPVSRKPRRRKKHSAPPQTCSFCGQDVAFEELFSFSVAQVAETDAFASPIRQGAWCHLSCLNERLHPRHLVQNWRFDPEEIEELARGLVDFDDA